MSQPSLTLCDLMGCSPPGSFCPWEFPRPEYWSGLPFPSPGDLLDPGMELGSLALQEDSLPTEPPGKPQQIMLQMNSVTPLPKEDLVPPFCFSEHDAKLK